MRRAGLSLSAELLVIDGLPVDFVDSFTPWACYQFKVRRQRMTLYKDDAASLGRVIMCYATSEMMALM